MQHTTEMELQRKDQRPHETKLSSRYHVTHGKSNKHEVSEVCGLQSKMLPWNSSKRQWRRWPLQIMQALVHE